MKRKVLLLLLALIVGLIPAVSLAAVETLSPQTLEIANSLNCPICEGESVRDSHSQLAQQMREVIQEKVDAGESRDQIMSYFVDRYGVGILRDPPKSGFVLTLWWVPVAALAIGALILGTFMVQKRGRSKPGETERSGDASDGPSGSDLQRYQERFLADLENSDMRAP